MSGECASLYETLIAPSDADPSRPLYAAQAIPGLSCYMVAKDREGQACLLVAGGNQTGKPQSPIRLERLDVQFELRCQIRRGHEVERTGTFTVIRCRSLDSPTIRYFLGICETIVEMIGDKPRPKDVGNAVHQLATIFQKIENPPQRSVLGLFAELYLIWRSGKPASAVASWRLDEWARFDFSNGNIRLDVKATIGRKRVHTFSYEQCNPPAGTVAVVASCLAERLSNGLSLACLIEQIKLKIGGHSDLIMKVHEVVAGTLGASLSDALNVGFDEKLVASSLRFFRLDEVPAVRGLLPDGVTEVHFRSDLSRLASVSVQSLVDSDPMFWDLLPV